MENKNNKIDKSNIIISGNDIDSIFINDTDIEIEEEYPIINIENTSKLRDISKNFEDCNLLKRDKNTDILSISAEEIDSETEEYVNSLSSIPKFEKTDIIKHDNTGIDNIENKINLDSALLNNTKDIDPIPQNISRKEYDDANIKKLSLFFENVVDKLSEEKRETILKSKHYQDYLSIKNKNHIDSEKDDSEKL